MDVVHFCPHLIQKTLDGAHRQRLRGAGHGKEAAVTALHAPELLGTILRQLHLPVGAPAGKGGVKVRGGHTEHHPVDGFYLDGRAVNIAHLRQTPAGRVNGALFRGQGGFQFLPVGLGGGKGMVAVPHRQRHGRLSGGGRPAGGKGVRIAQRGQRGVDLSDERRVLHGPARQMPAAQHQLALIQLGQLLLAGGHRLDEGAAFIVGQHQHMGRFQHRAAADFQPGRDALRHGGLAGADVRFGTGGVIVGLQIHSAHQALPDGAVLLGALHVHIAVDMAGEHRLPVLLHGAADGRQPGRLLRGFQIRLRQHDVQRAGFSSGQFLRFLPVVRLGGKLVHRDAGPGLQRGLLRQQDMGGGKAIHDTVPFFTWSRRGPAGRKSPERGCRYKSVRRAAPGRWTGRPCCADGGGPHPQ